MGEGGRRSVTILTIAILQHDGNCLLLNGRGLLEALLEYPHEELSLEEEVFKVSALGLCNILGLIASVFCGGDEAIFVGARAANFLSVLR